MPVPRSPAEMDWFTHFPAYIAPDGRARHPEVDPVVRFADIGCGFGGMTIAYVPPLLSLIYSF
jgi:tRNA (guanine-N7-)-methyltransferase